jgi:hypothetical protein
VLLQVNPEELEIAEEILNPDPHGRQLRKREVFVVLPFSVHPVQYLNLTVWPDGKNIVPRDTGTEFPVVRLTLDNKEFGGIIFVFFKICHQYATISPEEPNRIEQ